MRAKWFVIMAISFVLCSIVSVEAVKFSLKLPQIFGASASKNLFEAIEAGKVNAVKKMLDDGADVNAKDDQGTAILHSAAGNGNIAIIQLLLERGADINIRDDGGNTPLISAAFPYYAKQNVIDLLLDRGSDINAKNSLGCTALHEAARQGNNEVVSRLLERGADVNAKDDYEGTVLHYAVDVDPDQQDVVELLLRNHADADQRALGIAETRGNEKVVALLKSHGVISTDSTEDTLSGIAANEALFDAITTTRITDVKKALANEADVNAQDDEGLTPLQRACVNDTPTGAIVKLLLSHGADVKKQDSEGKTPLLLAVSTVGVSENVVEMLLDNGADVGDVDNDGSSALHWAARVGDIDIVRLLISRGVNKGIKNQDNDTALSIARENRDAEIVKLLRSH